VPLSLADNGTITFIKRSASTGCAFQLFRKKLHDLARPVWMPPDTGPLVDYATIEVKGDLVLLSKAFWQASRPPIVFNWRSARILYTVPESLAGFYRIHLATSGELGLTYIAGSDSSAVRVSLKTGKSRRFEFPHRAEPRFCGPLTFFGGRRLVKVYDADGETLYRHLTGKIAVSGFEAMCSSQYAYYSGTKTAGAKPVSHDYVLSLSKFRTRRINPLDLRSQPITRP
jgi:hypothetical protein